MRLIREIVRDALSIARSYNGGRVGVTEVVTTLAHDGSHVLILTRLCDAARRWHVPLAYALVRRLQVALFGIEIARDVRLGEGVVFAHTVGVVIGGNSEIGDRVWFLGGNTVGSLRLNGYPRIGSDVVIGAGARILGPVVIGDGASIGANAVVVADVPAGATAAGVPATVRRRADGTKARPRQDANANSEANENDGPGESLAPADYRR
jgi:serine O-acetyltransferase